MSLFCEWIAAVDEDGAEKAQLEKVLVIFAKHIIAKVSALASLSQADMELAEGWSIDLETRSFLQRCHHMAAPASAVKAQDPSVTDQNGGLNSQVVQKTAHHLSIMGNEISVQAIMAGIAPHGVTSAQLLASVYLPLAQTGSCLVRGVREGKACGKGGSSSSPAVPLCGFHSKGALARLE